MTAETKRAAKRYRVFVDDATCDGCGVCVFFCKPEVFAMSRDLNPRGVYPAEVVKQDACNNCRLCELGCPQLSIFVRPDETDPGEAS